MMNYIELKNVSFTYPNNFTAVEDMSMTIKKGEKVAIIGENGAGKTTTVKLMNGLMKPTIGDVFVDGWNTKDYTTATISKKVGYVFQNPDDQIFHNDVYSEIEFGPKMLGFSEDKKKELIEFAARISDVDQYLKENPYNLPFSIRKFVTIASVIAMDSDVLIFDEPTAGQDLQGMQVLSNLIDQLHKKGKTIIIITHDMEFVVQNFDRIIVLAHKNIIQDANKEIVFWNHRLLKEAQLKQPYISELAYELGYQQNILYEAEFIKLYKEKHGGKE